MAEFFPYKYDKRYGFMLKAFRLGSNDGVEITDDRMLVATYGRAKVKTPLVNIDHTEISGPHRWYKAIGLRLSFADDGITFGTNCDSGLCIAFKEKVPKVIGFKDHSALWVSVADPAALAAAIGV